MQLGGGLRVRKDMEARAHVVDEEALYLLTSADEEDVPGHKRKSRKRRAIPFYCSRCVLFIIVFLASLATVTGLLVLL